MSASGFSPETKIGNRLRRFLQHHKHTVLQLVTPGGQAPISISYTGPDGRVRTCFPDLISVSHDCLEIWVGELKPLFSAADKRKLARIADSVDGVARVIALVEARLDLRLGRPRVHFVLVHGERHHPPDNLLRQIVLPTDGDAFVVEATVGGSRVRVQSERA
jgi:hypothetical protein